MLSSNIYIYKITQWQIESKIQENTDSLIRLLTTMYEEQANLGIKQKLSVIPM
ncbi:hypothetical protein Mapa_009205 [Marchantia paleacea]|nr:hypothetical protein Mapa_009205 [Marchantia paleacea]